MSAHPAIGHPYVCRSVGHGCCADCENIGRRNALAKAIRHLRLGARAWSRDGHPHIAMTLHSEAAWLRGMAGRCGHTRRLSAGAR